MYANLKAEMLKRGISLDQMSVLLMIQKKKLLDILDGDQPLTLNQAQILLHLFPDLSATYLFERK